MRINNQITFILMYLGAFPFVGSAILMFGFGEATFLGQSLQRIAESYTLLIGSFMAGVHWGQHLEMRFSPRSIMALSSNLITLGFWFSYLFLPFSTFVIFACALFVLIFVLDAINETLQARYVLNRGIVTSLVCISLIAIGLA